MRIGLCALVCLGGMSAGIGQASSPQRTSSPGTPAPASLTGKWQVRVEVYGTPMYGPLQLEQTGNKLTGRFHGEKLEGTVEAPRCTLSLKGIAKARR